MACCYIAAYCISQLVKVCQFLDFDDQIQYNDDDPKGKGLPSSPSPAGGDVHAADVAVPWSEPNALVISVSGLTCSSCVNNVEHALRGVPGVQDARVSLQMQQATVLFRDNSQIDRAALLKAVADAGYGANIGPRSPKEVVELLRSKEEIEKLRGSFSIVGQYAFAIQVTRSMGYYLMRSRLKNLSVLPWLFQLVCIGMAIDCQSRHVSWLHAEGWKWLRTGSTNMSTLVVLAISLGLLFSVFDLLVKGPILSTDYFTATTGLTLTVVAGRYLEALSRRQISKDLIGAYKPLLETESAQLNATGMMVPSSYLRPSDEIVIEPFTIIPCDCYIASGATCVNESIVTGESLPINKKAGDSLLGGTRNLSGRVICIVRNEKGQSLYAQILQRVTDSSSINPDGYEFLDIIIKYFVILVIALAALIPAINLYWLFDSTTPMYDAFRACVARSMCILTSACPCALGLAIPSAVIAAVNAAQKKGMLLTKGSKTIDKLEQTQCIMFDKTGTLTEAAIEVEEVVLSSQPNISRHDLLMLVCALEEQDVSVHPVGKAIFRYLVNELGEGWSRYKALGYRIEDFSLSPRGVSGRMLLGAEIRFDVAIGSLSYMQASGVCSTADMQATSGHDGRIAIYAAVNGTHAATFYLTDTIRPEARAVIEKLDDMGYECAMLTGDMLGTARRVSDELRIPLLAAHVSPAEKQQHIRSCQESGKTVAMVGDGLNDAPSLAAADVGIGMCNHASFASVGASVLILNSRLDSIVLLFRIAKLTQKQIRFNLRWVFAYNALALMLASGWVSPFGFTMTPALAAAMMSASSIFLTFESFRLQLRLNSLEV